MSHLPIHRPKSRKPLVWTAAVGAIGLLATLPGPTGLALEAPQSPASTSSDDEHEHAFKQVNLVSDIPGLAHLTDPDVKNPWGIDFGPETPLWVSNNFSQGFSNPDATRNQLRSKITLYAGANGETPITKIPLEVSAFLPTGLLYNPTQSFVVSRDGASAASRFIWNENIPNAELTDAKGAVTGWTPEVPPLERGVVEVRNRPDTFDVGIALARTSRGPRLLVAGSFDGHISVYNGKFEDVTKPGAFVDPAGDPIGPYNVAVMRGRVYIAYAGETGGAVSVFTKRGKFIERLITNNHLNAPWGMVIAPRHWGEFGGDLLVGNVDNGKINAYDLDDGEWEGVLRDSQGHALVNDGLWGLAFGNGVIGTPRKLIFSAGIGDEVGDQIYEHGLVGLIRPLKDQDDD